MIFTRAKTALSSWLAGVLFVLSPILALGQVGPAMRSAPSLHIFGTYTRGSDASSNDSYGYSVGGFAQTAHLWALETRGSYLHWGTNERRYDALIGPRASIHRSRFSPYGAALGGIGHADIYQLKDSQYPRGATGTGAEWKILGGVDFYWQHHLSIRLGEVSYARVYVLQSGLSTIDYSAGAVYRFSIGER